MTTVLQAVEVPAKVEELLDIRRTESSRLDRIYKYVRAPEYAVSRSTLGHDPDGPLRWLREGTPKEVRRLADMSRVNVLPFVIASTTQVMYVDGFRSPRSSDELPPWLTWNLNGMNKRQIGIHRAANTYGCTYGIVLPGDTAAYMRSASPRKLTAAYGEDDTWPELALESIRPRRGDKGYQHYRLYDARSIWWVRVPKGYDDAAKTEIMDVEVHDLKICPVVRFLSEVNDDGYIEGDVDPLIPLQDQINVTTFGLLVAQHYGAFKQRYILGWVADDETQALKIGADKLLMIDEDPERVRVGEFSQTDLQGFINSREATLRHVATISQTPAHDLLGQLVNLSAEALAAAEASKMRKVVERQTSYGESYKQMLWLAARIDGQSIDPMAEVRWRDPETRSLASVVDALGKLAQMLGVPPEQLWELVPDVTQQQVERWKAAKAAEPDPGQP